VINHPTILTETLDNNVFSRGEKMKLKTFTILTAVLLLAISLSACSGLQTQLIDRVQASTSASNQLTAGANHTVSNTPNTTSAQSAQSVSADALAGSIEDYQTSLEAVYDKVNPAVVNIRVVLPADSSSLGNLPTNPFGDIPGFPDLPTQPNAPEDNTPQANPVQQALGSGFVWDQEGHIVTNNHVAGNAQKIEVTFADGTVLPAELVGADPYSDLAVVKVDLPDNSIAPIQTANTEQVKVGQIAIAIGNPYGLNGTMTVGIVSALGRSIPASESTATGPSYSIPNIIQTDAPINPGNSGGVLVDLNGELIGVPTAIESSTGANSGIGFAVPASIVDRVVPSLIKNGSYQHPYLGIQGISLTPDIAEAMNLTSDTRGAMVAKVTTGSPADDAGLIGSSNPVTIDGQQIDVGGDVITAIDNNPIKGMDDLIEYLNAETEVGQKVTLTVLRDGKQVDVDVTLKARPGQSEAQQVTAPEETVQKKGAWLGITAVDMSPEIAQEMNLDNNQSGILVQQVQNGSPADQAGLRGGTKQATINNEQILLGGDIITAIDGQPINTLGELRTYLGQQNPGQEATLTILRDGNTMDLKVIIGERPAQ
jgi:serine protease Do